MARARIAVVGSNMVDLVTYTDRMPAPGETIEAPDFAMGHGGKGANQAVAAAKLGADVVMVTKVGDDIFGANTIQNLAGFGIDTSHVTQVPGTSSGVAPIFVEPSGENSILIIKGANAKLLPPDVDQAAGDLQAAGLVLMQLEIPLETVYHTIARARDWGARTILNPAPAAPDLDVARLAGLDYLVPNETELATLTGREVESEDEIVAAARQLMAGGIGAVIVTLGARGVRLITQDGVTAIDAVRVMPVDTTGAGDAFIGAFAHFLTELNDAKQALHQAARYAAHSVTGRGTQTSYATAAEFAAFCATLGADA